jgi:hypothetical protein
VKDTAVESAVGDGQPFVPSPRMLRQFAAICLVFFGALAYLFFRRGSPLLGAAFAIVSVTVGSLGLARPEAIRPFFLGWMGLTQPIAWAISHLLLGCLLYGLFTPVGVLFRIIGRDALAVRRSAAQTSYWTRRGPTTDLRRYFRQF